MPLVIFQYYNDRNNHNFFPSHLTQNPLILYRLKNQRIPINRENIIKLFTDKIPQGEIFVQKYANDMSSIIENENRFKFIIFIFTLDHRKASNPGISISAV